MVQYPAACLRLKKVICHDWEVQGIVPVVHDVVVRHSLIWDSEGVRERERGSLPYLRRRIGQAWTFGTPNDGRRMWTRRISVYHRGCVEHSSSILVNPILHMGAVVEEINAFGQTCAPGKSERAV